MPREAVISVAIGRGMYGQRLKIADTLGALQRVGIEVPFRRKRIIAELRRCGYVVNEPHGLGRLLLQAGSAQPHRWHIAGVTRPGQTPAVAHRGAHNPTRGTWLGFALGA